MTLTEEDLEGRQAREGEIAIKASDIVVDHSLYPRADVSLENVQAITEAIAINEAIPLIVIDRKTKTLIDGLHRLLAHQKAGGNDVVIKVITKKYESEIAMFMDAMHLNASHGLRLNRDDKARCILRCNVLGIEPGIGASALKISRESFTNLMPMQRDATTNSKARPKGKRQSGNPFPSQFLIQEVENLTLVKHLQDFDDSYKAAKKEYPDNDDEDIYGEEHYEVNGYIEELASKWIQDIKKCNLYSSHTCYTEGIIFGLSLVERLLCAIDDRRPKLDKPGLESNK